jgi:hypothetical protein
MPRPCAVIATFALLLGCSFRPAIDPRQVRCAQGNLDGCPYDYTCSPFGMCCADRNGDGVCDDAPSALDGGDAAPDGPALADGTDAPAADRTDAPALADGTDAPALADGTDAPAPPDAPGPSDGPCAGCVAGTRSCGPVDKIRVCVTTSSCTAWSDELTCPDWQHCTGEPANVHCECNAKDCKGSKGAGDVCLGETEVYHCTIDGAGCYITRSEECPKPQHCQGAFPAARCACGDVPAICSGGQPGTFCESAGVLATCGSDVFGCFGVTSRTACPGGGCTGLAGKASCGCAGAGSPACPGIGRVCQDQTLLTCGLDAGGCLAVTSQLDCGAGGHACNGTFAAADCRCKDAACMKPQAVGSPTLFEGQGSQEAQLLVGSAITVDTAFLPTQFNFLAPATMVPRFVTVALYSSDAGGEPDRLVASNPRPMGRSAQNAGLFSIGAEVKVKPTTLPSGTYWLVAAFNVRTGLFDDTVGAPVPRRTVAYQVSPDSDNALPARFGDAGPVTKTMAPAQNFFLTIEPR